MNKKRFERVYGDIEVVAIDNWKIGLDKYFDDDDYDKFVDELNRLNNEKEELKKENEILLDGLTLCQEKNAELEIENEQLKQSLANKMDSDAYWEKKAKQRVEELEKENEQLKQQRHEWVNSVKREEIDKIFKMSIFEIAEAFEYYQKRIKELEGDFE